MNSLSELIATWLDDPRELEEVPNLTTSARAYSVKLTIRRLPGRVV